MTNFSSTFSIGLHSALIVLGLSATMLHGQTGQGVIVGSVTDVSGAVIPSAKVRVTDRDTKFNYSPTTNAEGLYRAPYLNPGVYEVVFEAQGFKRLVRSTIQVRATETVRLDVILEVGSVTESIEVGAQASMLETETSSTGHLVSGVQLSKLPSPQMKVESMLWYVPGVTGQGGNGHAAGGRSRSFSMTTDGVSALTPGTGVIGTGRNMSTAEHNMEEVKVITTVLPAEYGHSGGGVMSIVFKSGTNQLHGLAEERYMARHFIHRNWQDAAKPTNNFGFHLMSASISGPVVIPKLYNGRNKTFFLWGFQRHHEKASENAEATVPSPAMLAGDFSFGGLGDPVYDPASLTFDPSLPPGTQYARTQFPGNRIPLSRTDPVFNKFMSFNPYNPENNRNNQAFITRRGPQNNISADTVYRSYRTGFDWKIDHSFSDRHKIFGRESYFRHRSFNGRWQINVAQPLFDVNVPKIPIEQNQLVISDTFTVSPTIINEVRFGGNRRNFTRAPEANGQDWAAKFGIPGVGPETVPNFQGIYFTFPGGGSQEIAENMSLQENLTIVRGRHTFKTGYEILRTRHNVLVATQPSGQYNFGGTEFPFRPNTGNPFASFMLGAVGNATFNRDLATWLPRWWSHAAYFQDDWKINRKLTFNLGMRWQYESPFSTKWGQQSAFNPTVIDALSGRPGAITHPKGLLSKRDLNNFQPRIGMAYSINPRMVFRGGFAINTLDLWTNGLNENFDEYLATTTLQAAPGNPDVAFYLRNGPGRVTFPINSERVSPFVGTNFAGRSASFFDPNMRMPYTMNWNGGVQYELSSRVLLEVNYQGSASVGLLNRWDQNVVPLDVSRDPAQLERVRTSYQNFRPFTQFGNIFHFSNYGHSSFHSGTVKMEKRYSRGLSLTSFYTFAKAIDEASDDGGASGITSTTGAWKRAVPPLTSRTAGSPTHYGKSRSARAASGCAIPIGLLTASSAAGNST